MTRVLVTGSEGFIGHALANSLASDGHSVVGLDVVEHPFASHDYEYVVCDLREISGIEKVANDAEMVFHLAAISNLNIARDNPLETVETNVKATANLLEVCLRQGMKMIFASSDHVYGTQREEILTEDVSPAPNEIYAASKTAAEHIIRHFGARNTILRFGTVYGPRMRKELAIHIFLSRALNDENISINSPGTQKRQYIFIDDLVEGGKLAMRSEADGHTINLPGPEHTSVVTLANLCIEMADSKSKLTFLPARKSDIDSGFVSYEKAQNLLGWAPKVGMREGLARTLEWIRIANGQQAVMEQSNRVAIGIS